MQDFLTLLEQLRRPRLLIRAARVGALEYRRHVHLPCVLGYGRTPRSEAAIPQLIELEADLDNRRRERDATYSVRRHVEVLVALMAEARLLRSQDTA